MLFLVSEEDGGILIPSSNNIIRRILYMNFKEAIERSLQIRQAYHQLEK